MVLIIMNELAVWKHIFAIHFKGYFITVLILLYMDVPFHLARHSCGAYYAAWVGHSHTWMNTVLYHLLNFLPSYLHAWVQGHEWNCNLQSTSACMVLVLDVGLGLKLHYHYWLKFSLLIPLFSAKLHLDGSNGEPSTWSIFFSKRWIWE